MSSNVSILNLFLSLLILQVTKESFAANQHPFANLQFTPKEEYYNNHPPPDAQFSYNVPFSAGNVRFQNYAPPPPPQRFFLDEPINRNPNVIRDDVIEENRQKNLFKPPKEHFLDKREVPIRPKIIPTPAPLPHRTKLHLKKPNLPPPVPPTPPVPTAPTIKFPPACNCNQGYF